MTYPNAAKGVKKIYKGEKYGLVASILVIILGILVIALYVAGDGDPAANANSTTATIGVAVIVISIVIAALIIVEAILTFLGLKDAAKDDETFKTAYYLSIASLVISIIASLVSNVSSTEGSLLSSFATSFSSVVSAVLVLYVIQGITTLSGKLNNTEMADNGKSVFTIVAVAKIGSAAINLIVHMVEAGETVTTVLGIAELAMGILSIVGYFAYLKYLKKATAMLEQN